MEVSKSARVALTTATGAVPNSISTDILFPSVPRIVYIDDFIYKNSFYTSCSGQLPAIADFIATSSPVVLCFKTDAMHRVKNRSRENTENKPSHVIRHRILTTAHGNHNIKEEEYLKFVEIMKPSCYADFTTGAVLFNGKRIIEPNSLSEYGVKLNCDLDDAKEIKNAAEDVIYGTKIVSDLAENNKYLVIENGLLASKDISEHSDEYLKYMIGIKEIMGYVKLTEANLAVLFEYLDKKMP
ncbi:hypothetical protein ENBRE01_0813 [Enteropsectra breve]|nr:hypothetical protein ENBRE01_0813 [Enteropsectra breve]